MDYIRKQIDERINLLRAIGGNNVDLKVHYQSRFEYVLIYLLAYLWNKNISKLDESTKELVFQDVIKPSIGTIVKLCRILDIEKEVLKDSKLNKSVEKYPNLRNELLGHGFSFEDSDAADKLKELYDSVLTANVPALKYAIDLIEVQSFDGNNYKGINYKSDGSVTPWICSKNIFNFEINNLYGSNDINEYFRLSPFIEILGYGKEIYFFNSIEEKLLGKVRYNRLLETGVHKREWEEFIELNVIEDGIKIKTSNGTILNAYENNYKKYIDIGIKKKIYEFLTKNKASVCATVWGHGGVGKTASIQSVCDDLANGEKKIFDYIVFLSAKDRKFNYYTGNIEEIKEAVSSFDDLINGINKVVFNIDSTDTQMLIDYRGQLLIVVDDFETFSKEEKDKIDNFISHLNTNNHKVIITTRAANIKIGQEFQTNELTEKETREFLIKVIENEELGSDDIIKRALDNSDNLQKIFDITNGRPLFIFQFAFVVGQKGINDALKYKINEKESAINFLYGRIYEYLSPKAKDLFVVLSLLADSNNLENVIEKAQYILNLEQDTDVFNSAVRELIKLRIIKFADNENRFFEIYSKEILQMMSDYFQKRANIFRGNCISRRDQINKDKDKDLEHSLLLSANVNRLAKSEIEVIENYKQIINRTTSPLNVKREAILNLASYLVIDRGKKDEALKYLDDYKHFFDKNAPKGSNERKEYALFSKMQASYNWGGGRRSQKYRAIEILLDYAKMGFNYNNDVDLELSGMLLQFRSMYVISDLSDLKEKRSYNEISDYEFKNDRKKLIQICEEINNKQGNYLYTFISKKKLSEMSSGARQSIIIGLYSFLEVLIRIPKLKLAQEICEYMIYYAPKNFQSQFKRKQEFINKLEYKNKNYLINTKSEKASYLSPLGEKLQEALKKK